MKTTINIISVILISVSMSGCGLFKNYSSPDDVNCEGIYGDISLYADSVNMAFLPWQEIFTDETLKGLISYGLENNTDIRIARLRTEQADASLKAAKLAFLPSLGVSPLGSGMQFGNNSVNYTYNLPVSASWQIDIFGRLRNAKQRAKVVVENSHEYQKGVKVELIATIASQYYTLAMLREQYSLTLQSAEIRKETHRTMQLLMESGQYTDAAVSQAEADYDGVLASALIIRQQIKETENSLSLVLGNPVETIETNSLYDWKAPAVTEAGIPVQLLSMRPDVRQAELAIAAAFYMVNEARADFYPDLTLGGNAGWTNLAFVVTNPGKFMWDAMASLTQPVFQNGRLRAKYKIAQSQQEEAKLNFRQTLLDAGAEVNTAYTQMQTFTERSVYCRNQVTSLERTVKSTKLLMEGGSPDYLQVLIAQENLLMAQLSLISNQYSEINSCISLYQALGGGVN